MLTLGKTGPSIQVWIVPIITIALGFLFFLRDPSDLIATVQHAMLLIHSIFTGNVADFYQLSIDSTIMPAMYSYILYFVLGLLLLPVAGLTALISDFDYTNQTQVVVFTRISQLILVVLIALTAYFVYLLGKKIGFSESRATWAAYLYFSAPLTIFSDAVFWQYDVITLSFLLPALLLYFNKRYLAFSIVISIAIACKMFALFLFVPLVLLVEKRLLRALGYGVVGIAVTAFGEGLARLTDGYDVARELRGNLLVKLFQNGFPLQVGTISYAVVALVLIAMLAYLSTPKTEIEFRHQVLFFSFVSFAAPFILFNANTYWWILAMPFLSLLLVGATNSSQLTILAAAFSVAIILSSVILFGHYMDQDMVNGGLVAKVFGIRYSGAPSFQTLFNSITSYVPILLIACAFAFMIVLIINFAKFDNYRESLEGVDEGQNRPLLSRSALAWHNLAVYVFILPSLLLFARELILK